MLELFEYNTHGMKVIRIMRIKSIIATLGCCFLWVCFAGALSLEEACKKIPEVVEDPIELLEVVDELDKTNVVKFIEIAVEAAEKYPAAENIRSNKVEKLKLYAEIATNCTPTVVLKVPASEVGNSQVQLWLQGVRKTRAANGEDPIPMLNDGHEVILDSDFEMPRFRRAAEEIHEPTGYAG